MDSGGPPHKRLCCCVRICTLGPGCSLNTRNSQSSSSTSSSSSSRLFRPGSLSSSSDYHHAPSSSSRYKRSYNSTITSSNCTSSSLSSSDALTHGSHRVSPESLLDLSAKVVALHMPFAKIEERHNFIPEPVQRRIIYWSFPRNEQDICMYSSLSSTSTLTTSDSATSSSGSNSNSSPLTSSTSATSCAGCGAENAKLPFYRGLRLLEHNSVDDILQVGFHLSGTVIVKNQSGNSTSHSTSSSSSSSSFLIDQDKRFRVSITFDRCKITSVTCTCDAKDIFWCEHVVALALYRIRNPHLVKLRIPISETLFQLDREQLQKLLQYLIAEHHTEVLPTAQKLADEILQAKSMINSIAGAPDPTSGPCAEAEHSWHLDEDQVSEQVRLFLCPGPQGGMQVAVKQLNALFSKVKEMLRARDSNSARMLRLITEQFLADPRLPVWRSHQNPPVDKCRILWDQLASLWVCIVLNPHAKVKERLHWRSLLEKWSKLSICPLEDFEFRSNSNHHSVSNALKRRISVVEDSSSDDDDDEDDHNNNNHHSHNNNNGPSAKKSTSGRNSLPPLPRSIFQRALDACHLKWNDRHLRYILDHDGLSTPFHGLSMPSSSSSPLSGAPCSSSSSTSSSSSSSTSSSSISPTASCSHYNGSQFTSQGYPLWHEPVSTSAARVEALRSHGYRKEALRLAVAVVRTMKRQFKERMNEWHHSHRNSSSSSTHQLTQSGVAINPVYFNSEGWIGNLLDPIGTLFDTLAEASLTDSTKSLEYYYSSIFTSDSGVSTLTSNVFTPNSLLLDDPLINSTSFGLTGNNGNRERPRYQHIHLPSSRSESYLTLALEVALMGLGQQRLMPTSTYAQEKAWKQEEKLILKLADIDLDQHLISVLRKQMDYLLNGGPYSGFGIGIHPESVPMHTFAKFLFNALIPYDPELAYGVGLRAMRLPLLEGMEDPDDAPGLALLNNPPHGQGNGASGIHPGLHAMASAAGHHHHHHHHHRHHYNHHHFNHHPIFLGASRHQQTLDHIQKQQGVLAATMLSAAKENANRLDDVLTSAKRNIHSAQQLFNLAQNALTIAVNFPEGGHRYDALLQTSFNLGLQVMALTLNQHHPLHSKRKDMIKWIVSCAFEVGLRALITLMESWTYYFTPQEATMQVASSVMQSTHALRMMPTSSVVLIEDKSRKLALECLKADPQNCAVTSLSLCEQDKNSFDYAIKIINMSGASGIIGAPVLFQVAKYLEMKRCTVAAFSLALLAVKQVQIPFNGDTHVHVNDIHWTCIFAYQLGKTELGQLIPILVRNIQCAPVLSDILKKYVHPHTISSSVGPTGVPVTATATHASAAAAAAVAAAASVTSSGVLPVPPGAHTVVPHHHHHHHHHAYTHADHHSHHTSHPSSHHHHSVSSKRFRPKLPIDKAPLKPLLDAAIKAYVSTTHSRLTHISPRHYGDFIEFLTKAQETFRMSSDGQLQFNTLLENMRMVYKGKKKLMLLVKERFN